MQPRNKFQKLLVKIDRSLPKITSAQKRWAYKNCLEHQAVRRKSGKITCLDCRHSWNTSFSRMIDEFTEKKCPNCNVKIKILSTRNSVFTDEGYFTLLQVHKKFQVIRKFQVNGYYKVGKETKLKINERSRIYISSDGKFGIIGNSFMNNGYGERWFGEFALKQKNTIKNHDFNTPFVYTRKKILPTVLQNGYSGVLHTLTYFSFFYAILKNSQSETLLKSKQISLFVNSTDYYGAEKINKRWQSIKVCIRNKYYVKDARDWFDYLELLEYFGKDLNSPKYVCPVNFKKEHNKFVEKKRKQQFKMKVAEMKEQLVKDQRQYRKEKKQFFGLEFTDGVVTVKVIKSVKKVMELGDVLFHCIYTNEYHKEMNSLLLYATVDKVPVETIEVNLNSFKIEQSRGYGNEVTKFNKRIVKLVKRNTKEIKRLAS